MPLVHEPVEVGVDEVDRGCRAPVPEQPRLDVVGGERLAQQRVRLQVDLGGREEVRRAAVAADDRVRVAGFARFAGRRGGNGRLDGRRGHRGVSWRSRRVRGPRFTLAHRAAAVTGRSAVPPCHLLDQRFPVGGRDDRLADDEHGAWGVDQHIAGHASEKEASKAGVPPRAEHEHARPLLPRVRQDFVRRIAGAHLGCGAVAELLEPGCGGGRTASASW